jgi:hypothetical protein
MDAIMTSKGDVWVCSASGTCIASAELIMPIHEQDPPEQVLSDCNAEVSEVLRVLRPQQGIFLYLTFGQPHFRKRYLQRADTSLQVKELGDMFHYYLYVVKKD